MKTTHQLTTQKQVRAAFWAAHPALETVARRCRQLSAPQNSHNATIRTAFVDFVDSLARSGEISEKLASRVTL